MTSGLQVIKPGIYSLLQDSGRYGHHSMGITTGGPLDRHAFQWANLLCENSKGAAAIEVAVGGLVLVSKVKTTLAITGADISLKINHRPALLWQSHSINPGDQIELGFARAGNRAYVAVAGGFKGEAILNSIATVPREGLGGLYGDGAPLKVGDLLPCDSLGKQISSRSLWRLAENLRPDYQANSALLRVVLGYQQALFNALQKELFFSSEYSVTKFSDRMGYRLKGAEIIPATNGILSEGICLGAIQFPADGQPIILLNDRQTMGGYPKIGSLLSLDIGKLAQISAGGTVRFEPISIDQAQDLLAADINYFKTTQSQLIKINN